MNPFFHIALLFYVPTSYLNANKTNEKALGNLHRYYYDNKDLRLLLDLLAESAGPATSLRVLALFDKELNKSFKSGDITFIEAPMYHKRKTLKNVAMGDGNLFEQKEEDVYDLKVGFEHAPALNGIFSHMKDMSFLYTIELFPPTQKTSVIPVIIGRKTKYISDNADVEEKGDTDGTGIALKEKTSSSSVVKELENLEPLKDLEVFKEYSIRVNTIVNGKTLAYNTEWFGPIKSKTD